MSEDEIIARSGDPWIWGIYLTLCVISVIEFYSASSQVIHAQGLIGPLVKQIIILLTGFALLFLLQRCKIEQIRKWVNPFGFLSFALVILVLFIGKEDNGAARALPLYPLPFTIQPAELAKIATAMLVSLIISNNQKPDAVSRKGIVLGFVVVAVFGLLMFGNGLMNTALLMITCVAIMWIGGTTLKQIFSVVGLFVLLFGSFYLIKGYQEEKKQEFAEQARRIEMVNNFTVEQALQSDDGHEALQVARREKTWQSRVKKWHHNVFHLIEDKETSENKQEMRAHMAQAHGGLIGVGFGNSRECSLLPLAFSDYIYSIVVEETGFLGGVIMLILYLGLTARAAFIAYDCAHTFPALLIMAMAIMIVLQAITHMAINVGFFPVSGQTLPMISAGGTSTLVTSAAFGIMLSVSRHASLNSLSKKQKQSEKKVPGDVAPR